MGGPLVMLSRALRKWQLGEPWRAGEFSTVQGLALDHPLPLRFFGRIRGGDVIARNAL